MYLGTASLPFTHMSHEARKGALYNYLNLLLITVTGVFLTPFIVRNLGASQYGLYTLVGALIPYCMLLDMGMGKTITRYVAHYRAHNDRDGEARFMTTCIGVYGVIIVVLLVCGGCLYSYSDRIWSNQLTPSELHNVRKMIAMVVAAHVIIIPGNAFTAICNGSGLFAFPRAVQPIKYLIRVVCVIALLLLGYKAFSLIALEMILNIGIVASTLIYVHRHIGRRHIFAPTRAAYRPILKYSSWIALYATTYALQWNAGMIIAGLQMDAATIGVVGIGIMIGNMYGYFAETINRMTLPHATQLIKGNPSGEEITQNMVKIGRIIAIVQMGIMSAFAIFGESFIQLWAGESYREAYIVALMMMVSWIVELSQDYGNTLIEAKGRVKTMAIINFITIFAGAITSYYTSSRYGVTGLIGALSCGTILATIANNIYYKHLLQLNIKEYMTRVYGRLTVVTATCVTMFLVIRHFIADVATWTWLIGGIATYIGLYAICIYRCVLSKEEKETIQKHVQSRRGK